MRAYLHILDHDERAEGVDQVITTGGVLESVGDSSPEADHRLDLQLHGRGAVGQTSDR